MKKSIESPRSGWVALSIGNTHWRWGYFEGPTLIHHWKTQPPSLPAASRPLNWLQYCEISPAFAWHQSYNHDSFPPLCLASVVHQAPPLWLNYPQVQSLQLSNIPLEGLYPTLGIDRALAILGAGQKYGWPILVIDAGTALTVSGANANKFVGGAIAPGLGLQLRMLNQATAALPTVAIPASLPPRWANNTPDSILSGVIYSTLDSILRFHQHWTQEFSNSHTVLTGGDGQALFGLLQEKFQREPIGSGADNIHFDEHLIFRGMSQCFTGPADSTPASFVPDIGHQ